MEKKALDMFLDGWCKDCATDYSECAILGICKACRDPLCEGWTSPADCEKCEMFECGNNPRHEKTCEVLSYNKGGIK